MLCEIGTSGPRTGDLSSRKFHSPSPLRHQATQINANHRPNANSVPVTLTANTYPIARERMSPPGGRGSFPPMGGLQKLCNMCVCFHCHGTSSYHTTNTLQGRRAKSHVDTRTIQPGLGDFVLWTPYRPIPHFPPLQNPGGATEGADVADDDVRGGGGRAVEDKCPVMVSDGALFTACSE